MLNLSLSGHDPLRTCGQGSSCVVWPIQPMVLTDGDYPPGCGRLSVHGEHFRRMTPRDTRWYRCIAPKGNTRTSHSRAKLGAAWHGGDHACRVEQASKKLDSGRPIA